MDKHPTYRGRATARAKLNLSLEVLGCRPDGLHELRSVMTTLCLADQLSIQLEKTDAHINEEMASGDDSQLSLPWEITTNVKTIPSNEQNIVYRAAKLFFEHVGIDPLSVKLSIFIDKHIPDAAGLGGGSADAAAILRFLYQSMKNGMPVLFDRDIPSMTLRELEQIALTCGADVPFCVYGGTRLCEGVGEIMTPLPSLRPFFVLLATPSQKVQTKKAFQLLDEQRNLNGRADKPHQDASMSNESDAHTGYLQTDSFSPPLENEDEYRPATHNGGYLQTDSFSPPLENEDEHRPATHNGMLLSTIDVWREVIERDSLQAMAPLVHNDFISVISEEYRQVASLLKAMRSTCAHVVSLSGSGPTCFALFENMQKCEEAYQALASDFPRVRFIKTQIDPISDF